MANVIFRDVFLTTYFFWCTNQMIVQKVLAGRDLREGQKGALYVGFFQDIRGSFPCLSRHYCIKYVWGRHL